jgi:Uncharacterized protein conserved in bacteria (DUF2059)
MLRAALIPLVFTIFGQAAMAQNAAPSPALGTDISPELSALFDAVAMDENFEILAEIGLADAVGLEDTLFPGRGGAAWRAILTGFYQSGPLQATFTHAFPAERLSAEEMAEVTLFYSTDLGQRIVEGELTAWRAISDEATEEAANAAYFQFLEENSPRVGLLSRFIEVNGFVDLNVSGALNSNYAFYRGLSDAGAYEQALPPAMMLNEVWGQEPDIRRETVLWLYSFQLMAYEGLSDAEIETYIAFSETPAARAYTAALFVGFDTVFETMSYRLGSAAALFMSGERL